MIKNQVQAMEKLFSYGTLQMESVQKETFGRILAGLPDVLLGYVLSEVEITDQQVIEKSGMNRHPILRFTGNKADQVVGTVLEITAEELKQADDYEVEEYTRVKASFQSGESAWIYAAVSSPSL